MTNSHISGLLVLRGQDHKAVVEAAPDRESYQHKRLDIYGCKEFFGGALAWDLSVDGKEDGKNVSGSFLSVVITTECTDSYLPTHSSSKW